MGFKIKKQVRIPVNFFDYKVIRQIEAEESGRGAINLYLKILLKAKSTGGNRFCISDKMTLNYKIIGSVFNYEEVECKEFISILEKYKLIKLNECSIDVNLFWKNARDRNSLKYRSWRESVFKRDNYTCQICGNKGGELNAHHIKSWSNYYKLRYKTTNGITLCTRCHKKVHKGEVVLNGL